MSKNIQTDNAKIDLVKKFLDYANCADASYALLEYTNDEYVIRKNSDGTKDISDGQKFNAIYTDKNTNIDYVSTYARAIEARFNQDSKNSQGKKIGNKIQNVPKEIDQNQDKNGIYSDTGILIKLCPKEITDRTIEFTNRFRILAHQENTDSGFSATLFEDTQATSANSQYILAIRGSEDFSDYRTDIILAQNAIPMQCYFLVKFYEEQVRKHTEDAKLIVVGHSLGGYLTQSFCFMYPDRVAEAYTFNSPGLYRTSSTIRILSAALSPTLSAINYKQYSYNPQRLYKEPQEAKERYHQKILLLQNEIQKGINSNYAYLPESLKNTPIHHIKTDEDSNPYNNIYVKNFIQYSGEDIAGKHYYINLGAFGGSHFILPTINSLQEALTHMNSGDVDNLLEYNKIKDRKDRNMFLRRNRDAEFGELILHGMANPF